MLGETLRLIRVFHDVKQKDLAERLGVSQSHLSEMEKGKKPISSDIIKRYSSIFRIPASSIMFFDEERGKSHEPRMLDNARNFISKKVINYLRLIEDRYEDENNAAQ